MEQGKNEPRGTWRREIAGAVHRMPLVLAVALVMLGIGLVEWAEPRSVWLLAAPAIGLLCAAGVALRRGRRTMATGLGWFALLWAGATCHYLQLGPSDDALARRATRDYQPLVFGAEIASAAIWSPNSNYRPNDPQSERWRTQWKVRCTAIRDGRRWLAVKSDSTLSVAGRIAHLLPGDCITVYGSCCAVPAPSNPGQSDLRKAFRGDHQFVFLRAETADQIVLDQKRWTRPVARAIAISVRAIDRAISRYVPLGQAPLACALVFGQRQQVDWDQQQQLLSTGTLHMLAISGMHIELVAGALWILCWLGGLAQRTSLVVVATTVVVYALIAGANPPVLRAVFVVLAVCVAQWRGRRRGLANLLAFSGLMVLAVRTSWIGNVGVQLSFLAVATIAVFARGLSGRGEKADALAAAIEESWSWRQRAGRWLLRWTWQMSCLSFWIWLMTAPLIWTNFHVVSLVAIPLNILLWPLLVVGLLSGLALALLWWLPPAAGALGCACGLSLWAIGGIVGVGDRCMLGHLWLPAPAVWWTTVFYAIAAAGVLVIHFRPGWRVWLAAALVAWLALGICPWVIGPRGHGPAWLRTAAARVPGLAMQTDDGQLRMTFIDVGHGTSVLCELPSGEIWLYDAGHLGNGERSHQEIASVLWSVPTARIDRLFLSHADADHYNAVPGLVERFSIGQVIAPEQFWRHLAPELGALREALDRHDIPAVRTARGDRFDFDSLAVEVLHPPGQWSDKDDNGNSLTLLVEFAGRTCLLPGDLERAGLERLLETPPRRCDVLMAPHHGSLTQDPQAIFQWCQPQWVVVSGGPRAAQPAAVGHYSRPESQTAITHRDGAIQMRIDRSGRLSMWHWSEGNWIGL
ncbi:MAG: ComEC/Rec2 family competence protein [Aureliella sp.]